MTGIWACTAVTADAICSKDPSEKDVIVNGERFYYDFANGIGDGVFFAEAKMTATSMK